MQLKITDPKAATVKSVFLNGKRILTPVGFDTVAGWVDYIDPNVNDLKISADSGISKIDDKFIQERSPNAVLDDPPQEMKHSIVRKLGKVQVVFQDGTTVPPISES